MTELQWLAATSLMTALFWVPYVINRMAVLGIPGTLANPATNNSPLADWALRTKSAHSNAVENLVVFATLLLIANATGQSNDLTIFASILFFCARLCHFVVYVLGIPIVRTLAFTAGWVAQVMVAFVILEVV